VKNINVLFVCSKNQWRSPTAEAIYRRDERVSVRSRVAGDGRNWIDADEKIADRKKLQSRLRIADQDAPSLLTIGF